MSNRAGVLVETGTADPSRAPGGHPHFWSVCCVWLVLFVFVLYLMHGLDYDSGLSIQNWFFWFFLAFIYYGPLLYLCDSEVLAIYFVKARSALDKLNLELKKKEKVTN